MATKAYPQLLESILDNSINLTSDVFKVALVNNYTYDPNDKTFVDIASSEVSGTGYSAGQTVDLTVSATDFANSETEVTIAEIVFPQNLSVTFDAVIIYHSTSNKLISYNELTGGERIADNASVTIPTATIATLSV